MTRTYPALVICLFFWLVGPAATSSAASREEETMEASRAVLNEIVSIPLRGIPRSLLADAQGIAIVPNVIKGSFVIGARHGKGVLVVRHEDGNWQLPVFVSLTGGNIGWQLGLQATDLILVFKTRQSVQGILSGKLTLGADAAAAAGPVGREAAAATDGQLKAEILSYSRSRGLFAGVSIDGSVLRVEPAGNAAFYGAASPSEAQRVPDSAVKLLDQIATYCGPAQPQPGAGQQAVVPAESGADALRSQLAQAAPRLYRLLDEPWGAYLALPSEVFTGTGHPSAEALDRALAHFDKVAHEPRYRQLTERPDFQSTYGLLKQYSESLSQTGLPLQLPPPPGN